jgi:site-specific DNA-methyltransferase (adenine-specific)
MINLYNQDCMEAMAGFADNQFDLAIVDPPYGINFAKTHTGNGWIVRDNKEWDKEIPNAKYYKELFRVSKNQIIWGANYMVQNIPPSMGWIFWDKGQRNFSLADGELAFTSFNRALRVFDMPRGAHKAQDDKTGGKIHPTQKPVKLYEWLLMKYAEEGNKILDTHLGSGSIAIACHNLGYNLTGYEIDTEYYEAATKRLKQHQSQIRMF